MNRYIFLLLLIFLQFKAWSQEKLKIDSINAYQRNLENQGLLSKLRPRSAGKDLYNQIKTYNSYPRISSQLISMKNIDTHYYFFFTGQYRVIREFGNILTEKIQADGTGIIQNSRIGIM